MAVVTQVNSAAAVVRWAARFAQIRADALIVLCCLIEDQPVRAPTPVEKQHDLSKLPLLQKTREVIGELQEQAVQVYVMRQPAPAAAILGEIKDRDIDFLCIGMDFALARDIPANRLGRRLLRFAPCDMFVIDPGDTDGSNYRRVLLPLGLNLGPFTLRTAVNLAEKLDCTVMPLEVGSYFGTDSQHVARRSLQSKLDEAGIKATKSIQPVLSLSGNKWKAIFSKSRNIDLLLTGAADVREARKFRLKEKGHFDPETVKVPIGLVRSWNLEGKRSWLSMIESYLFAWLPKLEATDRIDLFDRMQTGARWNVDFMMMICLSTAIASLGLMQNSTAVVIGAMVVAPLMTPLIGAGLALVQGNLIFFLSSLKAMGFGIFAGLIISIFFGVVVPLEELTPELLMRGAPTLVDLVVAFLSGAAAAYALARPSLLGALAGVAIAAALVPPLATVGIAFTEFRWDITEGAAILLVTNLVAIILGAAFIYRLLGIQGSRLGMGFPVWVRRTVIALILLSLTLTAPLGYDLARQLREGQTRPYTLPVSKVVRKAIVERVAQEYGVTFISASRFGIEHDIDMVILLSSAQPLSTEFISDLKKVANDAQGENINVVVHALQEAGVKRSIY